MKREALFWGRIVEGLWSPLRVLQRVENGVVDGMPDCLIVAEGITNWLELKAPILPARPSTALLGGSNHKLLLSQRNWLLAHRQAGGRGWIAIETEERALLIGAKYADTINALPLRELVERAAWHQARPITAPKWSSFLHALLNEGDASDPP